MVFRVHRIVLLGLLPAVFARGELTREQILKGQGEAISLQWGEHCPAGTVCLPSGAQLDAELKQIQKTASLFPKVKGEISKHYFIRYFAPVFEDAYIVADFDSSLSLMKALATSKAPKESAAALAQLLDSPKRKKRQGRRIDARQFVNILMGASAPATLAIKQLDLIMEDAVKSESLGLSPDAAAAVAEAVLPLDQPIQRYMELRKKILESRAMVFSEREYEQHLKDLQTELGVKDPIDIQMPAAWVQAQIVDSFLEKAKQGMKPEQISSAKPSDIQERVAAIHREQRKALVDGWLSHADPSVVTDIDPTTLAPEALDARNAALKMYIEFLKKQTNPETDAPLLLPIDTVNAILAKAKKPNEALTALAIYSLLAADPAALNLVPQDIPDCLAKLETLLVSGTDPVREALAAWERVHFLRSRANGMGIDGSQIEQAFEALTAEVAKNPAALETRRRDYFNGPDFHPPEGRQVLSPGKAPANLEEPKHLDPIPVKAPTPKKKQTPEPQKTPQSEPLVTTLPYVLTAAAAAMGGGYFYLRQPRHCKAAYTQLTQTERNDWDRFMAFKDKNEIINQAEALARAWEEGDSDDVQQMNHRWREFKSFLTFLESQGAAVDRPVLPMRRKNASIYFQRGNAFDTNPRLVVPTLRGADGYEMWRWDSIRRQNGIQDIELRRAMIRDALQVLKGFAALASPPPQ